MKNNVVTPFKSPAVLSICTGLRGLDRGLERVVGPVRAVSYVEIEAFCVANLAAEMETGHLDSVPIFTDVKKFPARYFRNKVHWIIGGYPCQPFSHAGDRRGADDPRDIWPYTKKTVAEIKPFGCIFENVPGHLSLGFDTVVRDLQDLGYVIEAGLYAAEEVGQSHLRKRLFITAIMANVAYPHGPTIRDKIEQVNREIREQDVRQGNGPECSIWAGSTSSHVPVAYADGTGQPDQRDNGVSVIQGIEGEPSAGGPGESMANSSSSQLAQRKQQAAWEKQSTFERNGCVARPGERQHDWEEPRTVKPGMGCTVDGYNFREDLLRGLGNMVVEQQAAFAINDLFKKHGIYL